MRRESGPVLITRPPASRVSSSRPREIRETQYFAVSNDSTPRCCNQERDDDRNQKRDLDEFDIDRYKRLRNSFYAQVGGYANINQNGMPLQERAE
ncbi:hypothetical protein EVAR_44731_1 [Eumeta japonica]|uniref:Uncharacterized protein n=1 Tax=Eumeta variegata TaxID=151549 RepID=A0A4C1XHN0_EUMVA|nr:hypothetical protein EVAR_44731_1 [Eumeta japonica]